MASSDDLDLGWRTHGWRDLARDPRRSIFDPGTRVAGRYEIVRLIARGSVGEVYEAHDLELRLPLALKTIAPRLAADPRIRGRFRREIRLARQIAHRNVCRIHDLGVHRDEAGDEVLFLTMELLGGEPLAERIARLGPVSESEALPIVRQIAAGLAAAHRVGVVHRDLKSANVILEQEAGETRVVIADFGLARDSMASPRTGSVVTREGAVVGTPAYMAPEQVRGEQAGPAADVYAFGVVMFEMVTGRLPFVGDRPIDVAARRLREPPPRPRSLMPNLDPRWEEAILRSLRRDPEDRFASPLDVIDALEGERLAATPRRRRQRWRLVAALFAVGLLAIVWFAGGPWRGRAGPRPATLEATAPATSPTADRQRILILVPRQLDPAGDASWIGEAVAVAISTALSSEPGLSVIAGEEVDHFRGLLGVGRDDSLTPELRIRLADHFAADVLLFGTWVSQPVDAEGARRLRLDLRLDKRAGDVLPLVVEGRSDDVLALVERAGERVRAALVE